MVKQIVLSVIVVVFSLGFSSACSNPKVTSISFSTQDATIVSHIGYISEFSVECSSGQVSSLYAELEDSTVIPVAIVGPQIYQVSWIEDSKTAKSGEHNIRIFNEEGYAALRKALRAGDPTSSVQPFFIVTVNHPGTYSGPWVKSEFVAVVVSILVSYFALATKAKIVS